MVHWCFAPNTWRLQRPYWSDPYVRSRCDYKLIKQAQNSFQKFNWKQNNRPPWQSWWYPVDPTVPRGSRLRNPHKNVVYQDNMSTLSLAENGYVSSSKRTKHIKAKYFFVRNFHRTGELDLQYCPTELMWADVLTKPLQGAKFRLMHAFLMNCPTDYTEDIQESPIILPSLSPTIAPTTSTVKPSWFPSDNPTDNPNPVSMKHRLLRPNASSRGRVETPSHGTKVPRSSCTKFEPTHRTPTDLTVRPTDLTVSWRDTIPSWEGRKFPFFLSHS